MIPRKKRYKQYLHPGSQVIIPRSTFSRLRPSQQNSISPLKCTNENDDELFTSGLTSFGGSVTSPESASCSYQSNNSFNSPCASEQKDNPCSNNNNIICSEPSSLDHSDIESGEDEPAVNKRFIRADLNEILPNCNKSKSEVLLMVLHYTMRHNLSSVAITDLIKLINAILGADVLPHSKYHFSKIFSTDVQHDLHLYCQICTTYLGSKSQITSKKILNCPVCSANINFSFSDSGIPNFFVSLSIKDQLKSFFEDPDVQIKLDYRFKRQVEENVIRDIFDGLAYQKLSAEGNILADKNNFSITFSTDGAPVFKSNKYSIWPIQFYCNELPPDDRFNLHNVMLAGLWFGEKEPIMNVFLRPFVEQAADLANQGLNWTNKNGDIIHSRVITICCCVDSVAKPMVQCTKQFNGYFGCGYCLHPGELIEGTQQIRYTLLNNTVETIYRSDKQIRKDMKNASKTGKVINGVKSMSPLIVLPYFDLVFGFTIDYMHACLLGVVRSMTNLWLDTSHHNEPYYIGLRVSEIDKRVTQIKPPSSITRLPRPITDRCHWKANEWRSWLLYYSLPCLRDILPNKYYRHFGIFVTAIYIFLKDKISRSEIDYANNLLLHFVKHFQELYGKLYMTFNVHLLTHLGKTVSLWGPLWAYSAFIFESRNGSLLQLIKGSRGVSTQIVNKYLQCQSVQKFIREYCVQETVLDYCNSLMTFPYLKNAEISDNVTLLGIPVEKLLSEEETNVFIENHLDIIHKTFYRMIYKGVKYACSFYSKPKKSNDCVVKLISGEYVTIHRIFVINNVVYLLTRKINVTDRLKIINDPTGANASHIKVCTGNVFNKLQLNTASSIETKCILIVVEGKQYVSIFPNYYEKD